MIQEFKFGTSCPSDREVIGLCNQLSGPGRLRVRLGLSVAFPDQDQKTSVYWVPPTLCPTSSGCLVTCPPLFNLAPLDERTGHPAEGTTRSPQRHQMEKLLEEVS